MLDVLDKELEKRGHCFVRYADDCSIYVRSRRAGERVMASVTGFLARRLKLRVNAAKSAVDRPAVRAFLGFSFTSGRSPKRRIAPQALARFTDLPIDNSNLMDLIRAGRGGRWRIENETFNTLKNQGYRFEHNFVHGEKHLTTVFAYLMMVAFLIDQIRQRCCRLFQAAQAKAGRPRYFWEQLRALFLQLIVPDWETLYRALAFGHRSELVLYDTS